MREPVAASRQGSQREKTSKSVVVRCVLISTVHDVCGDRPHLEAGRGWWCATTSTTPVVYIHKRRSVVHKRTNR